MTMILDEDFEPPQPRRSRRHQSKPPSALDRATGLVAKAIDPGAWQGVSDAKNPHTRRKDIARRQANRVMSTLLKANLLTLTQENPSHDA